MTITNSELVSAHNFERFLACYFCCSVVWPTIDSDLQWSSRGRRTSSWGGVQETGMHTGRTAAHCRCSLEASYLQFSFMFSSIFLPVTFQVYHLQDLCLKEQKWILLLLFYFFHPILNVDFVLWVQNTDIELKTSDVLCLLFSKSQYIRA